ncbi:TPA: hypothetical protein N0F65_010162 [Lagenidium giganteum]|uniref:Dolichyl-diphosphooligosaccharide-protein glycosyltransferase subunit OST5 n=1 Tax=Lagenidium giganteum TaxID=4803 RepID=A0AAV2Z8K4_9STRA|nr:TPA: hypothetical protein N0F65_010162 [Lagenidium giganteum]
MMEIPHTSPVSPEAYGMLTVMFLLIGLTFMSLFFTSGVQPKKNFVYELLYAIVAALFLGFGSMFLFLWAEIYV